MNPLESKCLDAFPAWLKGLGDDARGLAAAVEDASLPEPARRHVAGALNYLFKSLDLIPDGIEDLGFVDDAFVFRVSAAMAAAAGGADRGGALERLAGDAALIREFLGADYSRLEKYVADLAKGAARGRSVDDILGDAAVCAELVRDAKGWAESYSAPSFSRDEKNLVKLASFLRSKLPA